MESDIINANVNVNANDTSIHIGPKIICENGTIEVDSMETNTDNYFICFNCNKKAPVANSNSIASKMDLFIEYIFCCIKSPTQRASMALLVIVVVAAITVGILLGR